MSDTEKINIVTGPAQLSLFLPVIARAIESEKTKPCLIDKTAMEIVRKADYDFSDLFSSITEYNRITWIGQNVCLDRLIRDFIRRYPKAPIVNIGCGMDTTYERLNDRSIIWYDLDLPDVISLKKQFIKETENRKFIAGSFLGNDWHKNLNCPEHILLIAGGVYYYYEQKIIRTFFITLGRIFPTCELLFDVTSPAGVKAANRMHRKGGVDDKYFLKWGLKNPDTILSWSPRLRFLGKYSIYKQKGVSMSLKNRLMGMISDALDTQYIVHYKIRVDYKHII